MRSGVSVVTDQAGFLRLDLSNIDHAKHWKTDKRHGRIRLNLIDHCTVFRTLADPHFISVPSNVVWRQLVRIHCSFEWYRQQVNMILKHLELMPANNWQWCRHPVDQPSIFRVQTTKLTLSSLRDIFAYGTVYKLFI